MVDRVASRENFVLVVFVRVPLLARFGVGVGLGHDIGIETVPTDGGEEFGVTASTIFIEPVATPVSHRRNSKVLALNAGDIGPFLGDVFGACFPDSSWGFGASWSVAAFTITIVTVEHTFTAFAHAETLTVVAVETSRVGLVAGQAHPFSPALGSEPVGFRGVVLGVFLEELEHLFVDNSVDASINIRDIDEANVLVLELLAKGLFVECRGVLSITLVFFVEGVTWSDIDVVEVALFQALVKLGFRFDVELGVVGFTFVDSVIDILVFAPGTGGGLASSFLFMLIQKLGVKGFQVFLHEGSVFGLGLDESSLGVFLSFKDIDDFLGHRLGAVKAHLELFAFVGGFANLGGASNLEVVDSVFQKETSGRGFPHGKAFGVVFGILEGEPLNFLFVFGQVDFSGVKRNLDIDVG